MWGWVIFPLSFDAIYWFLLERLINNPATLAPEITANPPLFIFFFILAQVGVDILGAWCLVEGLSLRVYEVDDREVRYYKRKKKIN